MGPKLPHAELPHVTVHFTPAFALSFVTTAVRLAVPPTITDAGGVPLKATEMGDAALIVIVAEAVLVPSATEVATTVTVVAPAGAV